MKTGITYIYSIDVIADVGEGVETFECVDRSTNTILNTTEPYTFDSADASSNKHTIRCRVAVVDPGQIELSVKASGASTTVTPHARAWEVVRSDGDTPTGNDETMSIVLFSVAGIVGLIALIAAVILNNHGILFGQHVNRNHNADRCPHHLPIRHHRQDTIRRFPSQHQPDLFWSE